MEIKEISPEDFDRVFPRRPTVYDSGAFNMLNATKAEKIAALVGFDEGGKPLMGQIFGLREGLWRAPFSAPFSAASVMDNIDRDKAVADFYASVPAILGGCVRLVWPAAFYGAGTPPEGVDVVEEANFHYDMSRFADFESYLSRSGRYNHHRAKKHSFDFFKTDDEYTDRMALQALAEIYPEQAERYAVDFWERKKYEYDEYQKIMVLHVLFQIHSPKLPHYLALAKQSEYRYLRENAEDLYDRLNREPHNG